MTATVRTIVLQLIRVAVLWLVDALSLLGAAWLLPGMEFASVGEMPGWLVAVSAALLLAIVNLLIRPLALLIALPLGWIATFAVGFLVNALALWITAWLLPGFTVSVLGSILGGIVMAVFNVILTGILELDEEGSFYQNRIEQRARQGPFAGASEPGRGLMMLEIDGLSYWHLKKALDDGLLPTLQAMIDEEGYQLTRVECGLPSMTSACQAGIMFGENSDIPAYRWFDKEQGKLYVSNSDAAELNARYAHGQGLMRGGSSIMNMMNGDAEKSLFTMANMIVGDAEEKKRRARDVALLMLNPYFLTRALALFIADLVRELWEGWRQRVNDVQPRLNRLEHWYPLVRAAMCALMRDISANIAILDMMRGAPSIYMLYLGYDEIAHHSGPWTADAFGDLKRLDKTLARLRRTIQERAPRPYDLIVLSDHGQSFGATFLQRYGVSLKEFIEAQLPQGVTVAQSIGGDTGAVGLQGMAGELANLQGGETGSVGQAVAKQGQKLAEKGAAKANETLSEAQASVTAYGSGNAAQVYFDLYPRKIILSELSVAYPGIVDALVEHPGIGMIAGYADDGTALVLGKGGSRNLHSGEVTGRDPLTPYAPETGHGAASLETRVWQMKRVMDFPHAGDLWVISTLYEDGTVAALEELIGSHGGVGGEQTDAFIFHPPDMEVPETRSSIDVFHILDRHRGAPVVERKRSAVEETVADWAPSTLWAGITQPGRWFSRAVRAVFLDRSAYSEVVRDPYMTGPALLIAFIALLLTSLLRHGGFELSWLLGEVALWVLTVAIVFGAGYLLTKRGTFTRTFRALGFAQTIYLIELLALFDPLASAIHVLAIVMGVLATWMGAAVAHETGGWRTWLLPVAAILVYLAGAALISVLLAGVGFTLQSLLGALGIEPAP